MGHYSHSIVVLSLRTVETSLLVHLIFVVADVDSKLSRVDAAVSPEEQRTEDWFGKNVENAIENGFGIGGNDVATLRETPSNWVNEPEEDGPEAANLVSFLDTSAQGGSMLFPDPDDVISDEEQSDSCKDEVTPLVGRSNKGANETRNDHDLVHQDRVEDGRPRETSSQEQIQEEKLYAVSR